MTTRWHDGVGMMLDRSSFAGSTTFCPRWCPSWWMWWGIRAELSP